MGDLAAFIRQESDLIPACDKLTVSELTSFGQQQAPEPPASCKTYDDKCPDDSNVPSMP
jgi:hypothetical protein